MGRQHRLITSALGGLSPGLVVALAAAVALGCSACGSPEPVGEPVFDPPTTPVGAPESGPERVSIYDAAGELRESDQVVAGLRLPRGLEKKLDLDRQHVYETRVPLAKVQRYFGPRLHTGNVSRVGEGATFRGATPRGATGAVVKLDVSIVPAGEGIVQVNIYELPPAPAQARTEAEIRAIVEREERERQLNE